MDKPNLKLLTKQIDDLKRTTDKISSLVSLSTEEQDLIFRVLRSVKFKNVNDVITAKLILGKLGYEKYK